MASFPVSRSNFEVIYNAEGHIFVTIKLNFSLIYLSLFTPNYGKEGFVFPLKYLAYLDSELYYIPSISIPG